MADTGTPPVIPDEFQVYNSYVIDPKWQRKFSAIWASCLGAVILFTLPRAFRALRSGQIDVLGWAFGVREVGGGKYKLMKPNESLRRAQPPAQRRSWIFGVMDTVASIGLWTAPGIELSLAQLFVIVAYIAIVLVCMITDAVLMENSNRAGFIAFAQIPIIFLFATKNSVLSLLLGPGSGYEKLNYVHRWSARTMLVCVILHGSMWINNHLAYGLDILGEQKETSGIAAFGVLCILVLSSLRPVRRLFYQSFFVIHVLGFVSFFITICYHTPYATPWIFPPLAFYGFDMLLRFFRYRIKDATLMAIGDQMTLIRIPDCDAGWVAGQHIRLRVFFAGRVFESHPLTIASAPPSFSSAGSEGILLGARVCGDWTKALNVYAAQEGKRLAPKTRRDKVEDGDGGKDEKGLHHGVDDTVEVPVHVMIDGPYGGSSVDLGEYESALLVAGGSGITFTLGLLDDIVGRCVVLDRPAGDKTKRIEFAWCIKSFGAITWFAPQLISIARKAANSSLDLHITIFVTCLCDPEAIPPIPNCDVIIERPFVHALLKALITPPAQSQSKDIVDDDMDQTKSKLKWAGLGGGVAVCASGPESLVRAASNAVAKVGVVEGTKVGGDCAAY
ncbi:hypothetical protein ONZ45_g3357 [Pleurotus djamor]|nr:hypothetical protein ONZ45_g3357 [Pleurotus djamor]